MFYNLNFVSPCSWKVSLISSSSLRPAQYRLCRFARETCKELPTLITECNLKNQNPVLQHCIWCIELLPKISEYDSISTDNIEVLKNRDHSRLPRTLNSTMTTVLTREQKRGRQRQRDKENNPVKLQPGAQLHCYVGKGAWNYQKERRIGRRIHPWVKHVLPTPWFQIPSLLSCERVNCAVRFSLEMQFADYII